MDVVFGAVTAEQREHDLQASENAKFHPEGEARGQADLDGKDEVEHVEVGRRVA